MDQLPSDLLPSVLATLSSRSLLSAAAVSRSWLASAIQMERARYSRLLQQIGPRCPSCDLLPSSYASLPPSCASPLHSCDSLLGSYANALASALSDLPPRCVRELHDMLRGDLSQTCYALWALGMIGGSSETGRRAVLESSLPPLLSCAQESLVGEALSRLAATSPHPLTLAPALPFFSRLLHSEEPELSACALTSLFHLFSKPCYIRLVVPPAEAHHTFLRIVRLVDHPEPWVRARAVRSLVRCVIGLHRLSEIAPHEDSCRHSYLCAFFNAGALCRLNGLTLDSGPGLLSNSTQRVGRQP
ncbi:MAG: hypothetical protein SGPRY_010839 [Prymnesium sp.]